MMVVRKWAIPVVGMGAVLRAALCLRIVVVIVIALVGLVFASGVRIVLISGRRAGRVRVAEL